ncbi:TetR/AcrR family transcriptional regulator [Naasia lichenicola]|uniref:TetR/AcrR family transcriptional regulator n=1 Tax=Naasia lichenicola TaxID=2565933 RepID=A0A4S4FI79_9MICO|nr:TetR/AcrR family transcriptional regulator [Naasia lichenicola]THG30020.1 TetR/AcrR family transcriptional regulator [Naasia lichenicola]
MLISHPDRRTALKALHRERILGAAQALVDERGGPQFSVDELAARADVARRTVFNHFASLDEILLTLCDRALDVLIEDFLLEVRSAEIGDGSRGCVFDEIVKTIQSADLPLAITSATRLLGGSEAPDARRRALGDAVFARAAERLLLEVARRYPEADPLESELTVATLISGVSVIAKHWAALPGDRLDAAGRAEWQRLLATLTDHARAGYLPTT